MTTRHAGYLVTLERDTREDDAAPILAALAMVRGVLSVVPVEADHVAHTLAEQRARADIEARLWAALRQERPG